MQIYLVFARLTCFNCFTCTVLWVRLHCQYSVHIAKISWNRQFKLKLSWVSFNIISAHQTTTTHPPGRWKKIEQIMQTNAQVETKIKKTLAIWGTKRLWTSGNWSPFQLYVHDMCQCAMHFWVALCGLWMNGCKGIFQNLIVQIQHSNWYKATLL